MREPQLRIAGRARPGRDRPFDIVDPATAQVLATVPSADADQIAEAAAAAAAAASGWAATPAEERGRLLRDCAAAVRDRAAELTEIVTRETGRVQARNALYVEWVSRLFEHYAELARAERGRIAPSDQAGQLSLVLRVPYGVVAAIVPWNYPLLLFAFKVAPALAAGNALVVKPAPETTLTTLLLGEILDGVLPPGALNVVAGGADVGEAVVRRPEVDLVAFTGSTRVGSRIATVAAELTKPTHLELSGKDPAIVFDDADPELAARGVVWAAFLNAGQVCTSTERVYVARRSYDAFVDSAVGLAAGLRVGDPFDEKTQVGPMRSEGGRRRVMEQIEGAVAAGAELLTGGSAPPGPGFYLEPAVLADVDHGMEIMREETFGPVLPIMPFDDEDQAFRLAADTDFGLGASIYTGDPGRVRRAYEELRVGTVWVNDPLVDNLAAPFGGMGASGSARELGVEGLDAFSTARHVHWNMRLEHKPWWFPPGEES